MLMIWSVNEMFMTLILHDYTYASFRMIPTMPVVRMKIYIKSKHIL